MSRSGYTEGDDEDGSYAIDDYVRHDPGAHAREASLGRLMAEDHGAGVHRTPRRLFADAIERSLGWASEDQLRALVVSYTGVKLSLGDANRFSQDVAAIVVKALVGPEVR